MIRILICFLTFTMFSSFAKADCDEALTVEKITYTSSPNKSDTTKHRHLIIFRTSQGKKISLIDENGFATTYVLYQYLIRPAISKLLEEEDDFRDAWKRLRDKNVANFDAVHPLLTTASKSVENYISQKKSSNSLEKFFAETLVDFVYSTSPTSDQTQQVTYDDLDQSNIGFMLDQMAPNLPAYSTAEGVRYKISSNSTNDPIASGLSFFTLDLPFFDVAKCGKPVSFAPDFLVQ